MRFERTLAVGILQAMLAAGVGCSDGGIEDDRPLRGLSSSEFGELCDEVHESLSNADEGTQCSDGSVVSFQDSPTEACARVDPSGLSGCAATAGDVRACSQAFVDDPCSASVELPAACAALQQPGCAPGATPQVTGGCSPLAAADIATFEGIYELVSHTGNDMGCDSEGSSRLESDSERFFVIVATRFLGAPMGSLQSCTDIAACRAAVTRIRELASDASFQPLDGTAPSPELDRSISCKAENAGAVLSQQITLDSTVEGRCTLSLTDMTLARGAENSLRLESRTSAWEKPAERGGCNYGAGERPESARCSALDVREARFAAAF